MRLLLINTNPAVSRLINLSVEKLGYEIDEFKNDDFDLKEIYDVSIIDSDSADENSLKLLKEGGSLGQIIYIGQKGSEKPSFADLFLQKPFLPTDFVDMIKKLDTAKISKEKDDKLEEDIMEENEDNDNALDLDELDSLDIPMPDDALTEDTSVIGETAIQDKNEDIDEKIEESTQDLDEIIEENEPAVLQEENRDEEENRDLSVSILDSEDIDEVKQLLEDDNEIENLSLSEEVGEYSEELGAQEELQEDKSSKETENQDIEVKDTIEDEISAPKKPEELELPVIEALSEDTTEELQEFSDILEDTTPENKLEDESIKETEKNSIEDLKEADFYDIFDDDFSDEVDVSKIKNELEESITKNVKDVLDKDEIKNALKGLKINISISFDEA